MSGLNEGEAEELIAFGDAMMEQIGAKAVAMGKEPQVVMMTVLTHMVGRGIAEAAGADADQNRLAKGILLFQESLPAVTVYHHRMLRQGTGEACG